MTPRDQVAALGKELGVGQSTRSVCFWCNGGRSKEASLVITRINKDTIAYNCHRESCGRTRGYIYTAGVGEHLQALHNTFKPRPYTKSVGMLDLEDIEYLYSKYGIDIDTIYNVGWAKAVEEPGFGLLMPVYGPTGELRGTVLRQEFEDGSKRVNSYKIREGNYLSWYRTSHADVVIVEDQISAAKASRFVTTVALLGSSLTLERLEEIQSVAKGRIWLARDKDATKQTFEDLKRYRILCNGNLFGLMLSKDIKNMTYQEIREIIPSGWENDNSNEHFQNE